MNISEQIIVRTIEFVKKQLHNAEAGHDWFHTERVWKLARKIAEKEPSDGLVVELAALLHDIADPKFHEGNETLALDLSREFLEKQKLENNLVEQVLFIIKNISFKNKGELTTVRPIELDIVQDADRLDAIGAIGVARTFNFGGFKNNRIYDPEIPPDLMISKEEYKKSNGTTINHFYEKLLLLKDLMNTETARTIAAGRHLFMEDFLTQFYREWNVE